MRHTALFALVAILSVSGVEAQNRGLAAFTSPNPDERGSTRILYWDGARNTAAGEFAINYGRPVWNNTLAAQEQFDKLTKGKVWRLGSNFWTVLDTNLPLKIGSRALTPGYWYLGLHRSTDGQTWSLAFIDPAKARSATVDPFEISKAPVEFQIPMELKTAASSVDKLTILLSAPKETPDKATLKVSWGTMELTVPVEATVAAK